LPDGVPNGSTLIEDGTDLDSALTSCEPGDYYITGDFTVGESVEIGHPVTLNDGVNLYVADDATLTIDEDKGLQIPASSTLTIAPGGTLAPLESSKIYLYGTLDIDGGAVTDATSDALTLNIYENSTLHNGMGNELLANAGILWIHAGSHVTWGMDGDENYYFIGSSSDGDEQYLFTLDSGQLQVTDNAHSVSRMMIVYGDSEATKLYLNQPYTLISGEFWNINGELHLKAPLTWKTGVGYITGNGRIIDEINNNSYDPDNYPKTRKVSGPRQAGTYYYDKASGHWREIK
jgi:hypothetical protein